LILLTLADRLKIPSSTGTDNRPAVPTRAPRRDEIASATVGMLRKGGRFKADLLLVDLGAGEMVVKDFAGKSGWGRRLGRIQIRRELEAYRWLGKMSGIPAFIGEVDALALAVEKVEGQLLHACKDGRESMEGPVATIRALIDHLHGKGVVHNDLRGRDNLMLRPRGDVVLLDLAGAICLAPGGLAHRVFFRWLAKTDDSAYLKWKEYLTPGRLTPEEKAFLRRFRIRRRMWLFNRK